MSQNILLQRIQSCLPIQFNGQFVYVTNQVEYCGENNQGYYKIYRSLIDENDQGVKILANAINNGCWLLSAQDISPDFLKIAEEGNSFMINPEFLEIVRKYMLKMRSNINNFIKISERFSVFKGAKETIGEAFPLYLNIDDSKLWEYSRDNRIYWPDSF